MGDAEINYTNQLYNASLFRFVIVLDINILIQAYYISTERASGYNFALCLFQSLCEIVSYCLVPHSFSLRAGCSLKNTSGPKQFHTNFTQ